MSISLHPYCDIQEVVKNHTMPTNHPRFAINIVRVVGGLFERDSMVEIGGAKLEILTYLGKIRGEVRGRER